MASRRVARAFLPIAREAAATATESYVGSSTFRKSAPLSSLRDLAVLGARYETSNYIPRTQWHGSPTSGRVPFVVPVERLLALKERELEAERAGGPDTLLARSASTSTNTSSTGTSKRGLANASTSFSTSAPAWSPTPSPPVATSDASSPSSSSSTFTMPPLEEFRKLNPEMAAVIERHEQQQRVAKSVRDVVLGALDGLVTSPSPSTSQQKINKTSINRLKVNALRDVLSAVGADARGNKAALVARVLDELRKEDENASVEAVAKDLGAGVASRKQVIKLQRASAMNAAISQTTATVQTPVSPENDRALNLKYKRVFGSPDDVAQILVKANAQDVAIVNVMHGCAFTDYMIIASATSHQSVHMVAAAVLHELKQRCKEVAPGIAPSVEGADDPTPDWLVVDAGSIVVHVFHEEIRKEYDLEGLWSLNDNSNVVRVAVPQKLTLKTMKTMTE